jgi:hypothetical protein
MTPHRLLLAAISKALGRELPSGASYQVLGGAVDPVRNRVAWIDTTTGPVGEGGYVPVDMRLHAIVDGRVLIDRAIESYNPYFGCEVGYLAWWGDEVVSIYREKHRTLVWAVPLAEEGTARLVTIEDHWVVDGDLVVFAGGFPGLLEAIALPSLAPRTPLPLAGTPPSYGTALRLEKGEIHVASEGRDERLRLPPPELRGFSGEDFPGHVERALLDGSPHPSASLVAACAASAFWIPTRPIAASYDGGDRTERVAPFWLPVYWYEYLRSLGAKTAPEAAEFLSMLDAIAAPLPSSEPERGWDPALEPADAALSLAVRHIRRRARILADVARGAALPEGWHCYLWNHPARIESSRIPRSVARAWETLAQSNPKPVSLSSRT